jgi:hypothetical protein
MKKKHRHCLECVYDCFLKYFSLENTLKWFFYFFKLFLISVHQNDLKTPKNINLKQIKN